MITAVPFLFLSYITSQLVRSPLALLHSTPNFDARLAGNRDVGGVGGGQGIVIYLATGSGLATPLAVRAVCDGLGEAASQIYNSID